MKIMKYKALRESCCEANQALWKTGLVDLTFGNVSVADPQAGVFAIKPSGVDYLALRPEDMVVVGFDGEVKEGARRASSDTPTHRRLFLAFAKAGIRSIVHTHSRCAVAFAQAEREIPCLGTTHADYFRGPVPLTRVMTREEIEGEYEWETGKVIVERYKDLDPMECPAVLVRGHGPFVWNASPAQAIACASALEMVAQMAINTLALNPNCQALPQPLADKHFLRKHGTQAYYGQPLPGTGFASERCWRLDDAKVGPTGPQQG